MTSRLLTRLLDGGEREVLAYAAGSLVGIALATLVLTLVVGVGLLQG